MSSWPVPRAFCMPSWTQPTQASLSEPISCYLSGQMSEHVDGSRHVWNGRPLLHKMEGHETDTARESSELVG